MSKHFSPELPALAGVVLVWLIFAIAAGAPFISGAGTTAFLNAAAPLGIIAVPVALLMIAGEFDLSIGSIIGLSGMMLLLGINAGWPFPLAAAFSLIAAVSIGLLNGYVVVRSKLPSFIVTLATLFIARGLTIAVTRLATGRTQLGGIEPNTWNLAGLNATVFVWILATAIGAWVLTRSRFGNWIFAAGGSADAARALGVPVARVKLTLFLITAISAWTVALLQALRYGGADALRGEQQEFRAIVAVVIGGTLLTGGAGSVLGAAAGALVFGMLQQGIVLTGLDADWFQVMLGALLLIAVLSNRLVARRLGT